MLANLVNLFEPLKHIELTKPTKPLEPFKHIEPFKLA